MGNQIIVIGIDVIFFLAIALGVVALFGHLWIKTRDVIRQRRQHRLQSANTLPPTR